MQPSEFAAQLRELARTDPVVSSLALLIASAVEPVREPVPKPVRAEPGANHEPIDPIIATVRGHDYTAADLLILARGAYEGPGDFDALPAEEQSLHAQLALSKLRQDETAEQAG